MPKVSILIAVFNGGEVIRNSVTSLQQQTMKDIEIICVDDYSTDNSAEIIREMQKDDPRIKLVSAPENMGTVHSRKAGVENAEGEFLMFMDQDDRYEPFAVEELYNMITEKDVDIIQFRSRVIAVPPTTEKQRKWQEDFMQPYDGFLYGKDVFDGCFAKNPDEEKTWYKYTWNLWNKIYRTDVCKKAMKECTDDYIINGDDMYVYMLISYYAASYYGDANGKFYHIYSLGSGLMGNHKLSLRRFYTLIRRVTGLENEKIFFDGIDESYREAYYVDVRRGIQGIAERWYNRLEPESYADGYDMIVSYLDPAEAVSAFEKHLNISSVSLYNAVKNSAAMQLRHKYTKQLCIYVSGSTDYDALEKAIKTWRAGGCRVVCCAEDGYTVPDRIAGSAKCFSLAPVKSNAEFYEYPIKDRLFSLEDIIRKSNSDCLVYFSDIRHEYIYDLIIAKSMGIRTAVYASGYAQAKSAGSRFREYVSELECSDVVMLPEGCTAESDNDYHYCRKQDLSDAFTLGDPGKNAMDAVLEDKEFKEMCEKLAWKRMFRQSDTKTKLKLIVKKVLRIAGVKKEYYSTSFDSYYMLKNMRK